MTTMATWTMARRIGKRSVPVSRNTIYGEHIDLVSEGVVHLVEHPGFGHGRALAQAGG
jgi:hypothetical protein